MEKAIKHFERELITIRTGRAHAALVESIKVNCYGFKSNEFKEIASIASRSALNYHATVGYGYYW